jgi:hypothetical protein
MQQSVIEKKEIAEYRTKLADRYFKRTKRRPSKSTRTTEELRELDRASARRAEFPTKCAGLPRRHRWKLLKLGR